MRDRVDVAIVGGGLAGSTLALTLREQGITVALCDRHASYPSDFRAEKLSAGQARRLAALGLGDGLRRAATPIDELAVARCGRIVERRPNDELGIDYADLVALARALLPAGTLRVGRVASIEPMNDGRAVIFADGRRVEASLVVLATGLGRDLVEALGLARRILDAEHSLAIGFDLVPENPSRQRLALTYYAERLVDRSAFLTLFPLGERMRANLFVYHRRGDDWADVFRGRPAETLRETMPGLASILGDFSVPGRPVLRPIALHVVEAPARDHLVLVGDAFATTCPTGGTGVDKVLTDVERLAALAPGWIASGDTGAAAVARFYADPAKRACDANARRMVAYARGMALDPGLLWTARRRRNFWALSTRDWLRRLASPSARSRAT